MGVVGAGNGLSNSRENPRLETNWPPNAANEGGPEPNHDRSVADCEGRKPAKPGEMPKGKSLTPLFSKF